MKRKSFITAKYISMLFSGTVIALLSAAMFMADALIAGIMLGEAAVAGVNVVLPIYSLASFAAMVFSLGVPILYVNELGAFHKEKADRVFGVGLLMAVLTGAILFVILMLVGDSYLYYYVPEGPVFAAAHEYLVWIRFVVLLMPANYLLTGMIFADGDEMISMAANIVSGGGNVLLGVLLCHAMGVSGLGLASFISLGASFFVLFLHFFLKKNSLRLRLGFSLKILGEIVSYSVVDASAYFFISFATAVINIYVVGYFGVESIILVSVVALIREIQLVFDGIGEAVTPIMSMYLGEETYPGVREVWRLARKSVGIESLIVSLLLIALATPITGALGITDPGIAEQAAWGLRLLAVTLLFPCRMYLDSSYYILINRIPLGVLVCALRDILPAIPFAILGGWIGGIYGMFVGLMIAQPAGYLLLVLYVSLRYGRENYALFLVEKEKNRSRKLYDFEVRPETVIHVRNQIGDSLKEQGCSERQLNETMLLFEEFFMLVYEKNPERKVLAECAVEAGETIHLITRDDGVTLDLTDEDQNVQSLRAYVLANLIATYTSRKAHFLTLSYNRNAFEVR